MASRATPRFSGDITDELAVELELDTDGMYPQRKNITWLVQVFVVKKNEKLLLIHMKYRDENLNVQGEIRALEMAQISHVERREFKFKEGDERMGEEQRIHTINVPDNNIGAVRNYLHSKLDTQAFLHLPDVLLFEINPGPIEKNGHTRDQLRGRGAHVYLNYMRALLWLPKLDGVDWFFERETYRSCHIQLVGAQINAGTYHAITVATVDDPLLIVDYSGDIVKSKSLKQFMDNLQRLIDRDYAAAYASVQKKPTVDSALLKLSNILETLTVTRPFCR